MKRLIGKSLNWVRNCDNSISLFNCFDLISFLSWTNRSLSSCSVDVWNEGSLLSITGGIVARSFISVPIRKASQQSASYRIGSKKFISFCAASKVMTYPWLNQAARTSSIRSSLVIWTETFLPLSGVSAQFCKKRTLWEGIDFFCSILCLDGW